MPATSSARVYCAQCGAPNTAHARFCDQCGNVREDVVPAVPAQRADVPEIYSDLSPSSSQGASASAVPASRRSSLAARLSGRRLLGVGIVAALVAAGVGIASGGSGGAAHPAAAGTTTTTTGNGAGSTSTGTGNDGSADGASTDATGSSDASGSGDAGTDGSSTVTQPAPPPPALGSRGRPLPLGRNARVGDDWRVTVISFQPYATNAVMAANEFNDRPTHGSYGLARLRVTYLGSSQGTPGMDLRFVLSGGNHVQYADSDCNAVAPQSMLDAPDLERGGSATADFCVDFPPSALRHAVLFVEPEVSFSDSGRKFWAVS